MDALLQAGLTNAAWATALAVAAAIGARIWRRHPAVAHVLWLLVLLKLVTPSWIQVQTARGDRSAPVEPAHAPRTGAWALGARQQETIRSQPSPEEAMGDVGRLESAPDRRGPRFRTTPVLGSNPLRRPLEIPARNVVAVISEKRLWRPILAGLWLVGAGVWWTRMGWNCLGFRRLIHSARPAESEVGERIAAVAARLGLRRIPTAWILPARVPPMLWVPITGPPRLVLPGELWGRLDEAQQNAVLAHELAHLKRRDHWVRRLEALACGLYWWDPFAWWARREIERAEEQCCDAWVLWALPAAAAAYAEALVVTAVYLAGLRQPLPFGASGVGRLISLKRRLEMIVCDSGTGSVARTAPRALLLLGIVSLPFLPALASGKPPGDQGQVAADRVAPRDQPAHAATNPAQTGPRSSAAATPNNQKEGGRPTASAGVPAVWVSQPIHREVGDSVDLDEVASLGSPKIELRARVSGSLDRVDCRTGQRVKKGDILFAIDPRPYQAELDKANAEVRRAQARLKVRQSELANTKSLLSQGRSIVSQGEVHRFEIQCEEAEAAVQAAQADRDLALLKLESTKVAAPIDGVMARVIEQSGAVVFPENRTLAEIISLDPLQADFYIDEDTALLLKRLEREGAVKPGAEPAVPVLIGVRDEEGFPHRGRLFSMDPEVQPIAETAVHCRAVIPNPDGSLAPGLKARVRLVTNRRHKALLVPKAAVHYGQDARRYVLVVNSQDIVEKRLVRVGLLYNGLREVEDGLKTEDRVILHGPGLQSVGWKVFPERVQPEAGSSSEPDRPGAQRQ